MTHPKTPGAGSLRLAAVQMEPRIGETGRNIDAGIDWMRQAAAAGARLVAFPECSLTGYCFNDRAEAWEAALERDGAPMQRLAGAAAELDVFAAVGYLERIGGDAAPGQNRPADGRIANSVSILGPRGPVAHYRKTHLPHLGVDRWVDPGCEPFTVHEVAGLKVGLLICYDASFPEATRALALAGADLVLLPTNWPEEAVAKADWLPNTRAYENVIYFAAVNRVGTERGYVFHGKSRVCGPAGEVLAQGPADTEAMLLADIDPLRSRTKRIVRREGEYWVDRIGQRREDLYRLSAPPPENDAS